MRIGGLASGIDTESIIKDLMKAERLPLDKVTQKKQYFEWQLDNYRSANRDLKSYSQNLSDNIILSKNYRQQNVSISSPDDVAIKSKGSTTDFSGTLKIEQLATNASRQSDIKISSDFVLNEESSISIIPPGGDPEKPKVLTFEKDTTLDQILKRINDETGVRAFYDSKSQKIGMSAKESGGDSTIDEKEVVHHDDNSYIQLSGGLATQLGFQEGTAQGTPGTNAKFTYNGMDIERSSNSFELDGMEITLKVASSKNITFNATTDTEKVFDTVKKFVDDYNKLIEDLNKKIREPKYRDFQPLSAEQKADMKDKEIEQWEEKAKSGTLRNDPELSSLLSKMRGILTESVYLGDGKSISLNSIGITTSKNYLEHGKLEINETKLKEAISKDPGSIEKLFANKGDTHEKDGLAFRLNKAIDSTQKVISKNAGKVGDSTKSFDLGRSLDSMNKQIERFEDRMKMVETRYWKQFTAMENAIQRANMQSANLMNSLGGGA